MLGEDLDRARRPAPSSSPSRVGPEPDLARPTPRRSRRARRRRRPRDAGRGLEQERGLADPRLAAEEDQRARDEPAAEDPIELADARRQARDVGLADVARGRRASAPAVGARRAAARRGAARLADDGLDEAVPRAAGAALAFPAQEGLAAALADVAARGRAMLGRRAATVTASTGVSRLGGVDVQAGLGVLVDDDRRARLVAAEQEVLGEDVLDHVLDDPAQRSGAVGHVVAELDDVLLGRLR